jgi:CHASE2 domain-containing sensor protein
MGNPVFQPSHFTAVVLFALFASIVFGITQRETPRRMIRYGIYCFVLFVGSTIAISWLMFLIAR